MIYLSSLLKKYNGTLEYSIIDEKPFDIFSRITSDDEGRKCIFLSNAVYLKKIDENISMVITKNDIASELKVNGIKVGICITEDPKRLFFELLDIYESENCIKKETTIGSDCIISDKAVISEYNVKIGNNVRIEDFVVISPNVEIGDNTVIQAGAKIGIQDFNLYEADGNIKQIKHNGKVVIDSDVLIGPNSIVGQAMYDYGTTHIGQNTKISELVMIGHNCDIGSKCEICGGSFFGGYVNIADGCYLGIGCRIKNAVSIGENVKIDMGSVVIRDIPDGQTVFGNPARQVLSPKA